DHVRHRPDFRPLALRRSGDGVSRRRRNDVERRNRDGADGQRRNESDRFGLVLGLWVRLEAVGVAAAEFDRLWKLEVVVLIDEPDKTDKTLIGVFATETAEYKDTGADSIPVIVDGDREAVLEQVIVKRNDVFARQLD